MGKDIIKFAGDIPGPLGTGGMLSKIKAAAKVTASGIPMVIANGGKPDILKKLFSAKEPGTFFVPKKKKLKSRKCWIAFTLKPKGVLIVDDGAAAAIMNRGKSLLPSGIVGVEGDFGVGDPVEFKKGDHETLGTGLVNYSATDIRKIMGLKSNQIKKRLGYKLYDDVIHRDNLAITAENN
jgi:glutamate 5-kinase